MAKYRHNLPLLGKSLFLTDAGLETDMIFHKNLDLPNAAAFHLLRDRAATDAMMQYYRDFCKLAQDINVGFILETPTWRANPDWAASIGYSEDELAEAIRKSVKLMEQLRGEFETGNCPMVISGALGPRGDGYVPSKVMTAEEAEDYHSMPINVFKDTEVDLVTAFTLNYAEEAVGIARAARAAGLPAVISFTVETDGSLPTGQNLKDVIAAVDAATNKYPLYYMINCAHPTHFADVLASNEPWLKRIGAIRANASCKSHAELDESEVLDEGNPEEFGRQYVPLVKKLPNLRVIGGCCGTDIRHVREIAKNVLKT